MNNNAQHSLFRPTLLLTKYFETQQNAFDTIYVFTIFQIMII